MGWIQRSHGSREGRIHRSGESVSQQRGGYRGIVGHQRKADTAPRTARAFKYKIKQK